MDRHKLGNKIMCRPVLVCVIFMVLFRGYVTFTQSQKGTRVIVRVSDNSDKSLMRYSEEHMPDHKLHAKLFDATSDFPSDRQKRALISIGRWATNFILRKARLVKSNRFEQIYIKPTGFKNALDDFKSVKPVNVLQMGVVKTGELGDKSLNVFPPIDNSPPSMMIIPRLDFDVKTGEYFKTKIIFYGDYEDIMKFLSN